MLRIGPLLLFGFAALASAAENHALALSAGATYRYTRTAREITDETPGFSWTEDYGYHARLSTPAEAGTGAFDLDWARNRGNGDRIDTLGVLYVQRIPLGSFRLGVGLGSFYNDLSIADSRHTRWTIGCTALVSKDLVGPLYLEAGYDLTSLVGGQETGGIRTDCVFLDLGIRF